MNILKYETVFWGFHKGSDPKTLYLTQKDVNHLNSIYKKNDIQPESINSIVIELIGQREKLLRYMLKEVDFLLKHGGSLEIILMDDNLHSAYTRSIDQVMYEVAISTNGRYSQIDVQKFPQGRIVKLKYLKKFKTLPENDYIGKWSFGVITNGKNQDHVDDLICSILNQNIPECEILVCGNFSSSRFKNAIKILEDVVLPDDIRAPISAKKNKIIRAARYNNICILHDRFYLPPDWYARQKNYGNYFDFLCLPTRDFSGRRFLVDWMHFCYPITQTCTRNKSLKYTQWSSEQIIQGGVILGKKHLIESVMLDERLHWRELEDIHFSKMLYLNGAFFNVDPNNYLISLSVNHSPQREHEKTYFKEIIEYFNWYILVLKNYIKFHICKNFVLKNGFYF